MITYKYWLYYTNSGRLTAYTDDKEIAKLFESQRNFKYYHKDKQELTKEEVNYLAEKCYAQTLRKIDLPTQNNMKVTLALTETEIVVTQNKSLSIQNEIRVLVFYLNPEIFNNKIKKALLNNGIAQLYHEIDNYTLPEKYKEITFYIDELEIFLQEFGKYMKLEEE